MQEFNLISTAFRIKNIVKIPPNLHRLMLWARLSLPAFQPQVELQETAFPTGSQIHDNHLKTSHLKPTKKPSRLPQQDSRPHPWGFSPRPAVVALAAAARMAAAAVEEAEEEKQAAPMPLESRIPARRSSRVSSWRRSNSRRFSACRSARFGAPVHAHTQRERER